MKLIKKKQKLKIQFNEQGKCPVCGNEDSGLDSPLHFKYYDEEFSGECGYIKLWQCRACWCTGKEYYEFTDHYDIYSKNGITRIDSESEGDFPYLKRKRLFSLLKKAISAIHDLTGKDKSYVSLHDLQDDLDITADEYDAIMGGK